MRGRSGLLDLGTNPLLLSIVCALYYNDLKIPAEPDELYARTVEGLLGAWDAFRNIARDTPIRDLSVRRRAVLMSWISATMFERGKLVFSARDVDDTRVLIRFADSTHTAPLSSDELLTSLYNDFGILIERAPGRFSFSHLTFQEYLTAQYIVDNRREIQVLRRRREKTWTEVMRLVAKMLPNANIYMAAVAETTEISSKVDLTFLAAA
jgi:predicted NACHT family NTPase